MDGLYHRRSGDLSIQGKEIFEVTPVILDGSAIDSANKTFLAREEHIKAVAFWNRIIAKLKSENDR
jgi:hypothetical protein